MKLLSSLVFLLSLSCTSTSHPDHMNDAEANPVPSHGNVHNSPQHPGHHNAMCAKCCDHSSPTYNADKNSPTCIKHQRDIHGQDNELN